MNAGQYCNRNVVVISGNESVQSAAELMRHHHVGDLVIVDQSPDKRTPLGVVTDRDLVVDVLAADLAPRELQVRDIVSEQLLVIPEDKDLLEALQLMRNQRVRRVPVVDYAGNLAGILTVDDALGVLAEMLENMALLVHSQREKEVHRRP